MTLISINSKQIFIADTPRVRPHGQNGLAG